MRPSHADTARRFDAFLSYSHAADSRLAPVVQQTLHDIKRSWYQTRAVRVCRDRATIPFTAALWPAIERHLADSRYLILLASPEAADSDAVGREVRWWLEHRSAETILIGLTGGEIGWDAAAGDFDWQVTTALPRALAGAFGHEPNWADLRFARVIEPAVLSARHTELRDVVAGLAATLHGLSKDEVHSQDERRRVQTRRTVRVVGAILVLLTVAAIVQSVRADREADAARRSTALAYDRLANLLAAESTSTRVNERDPRRALLLALSGLRLRETAATRAALFDTLESQPYLARILAGGHTTQRMIVSNPPSPSGIQGLAYQPGTGTLFSAGDDGRIVAWNPATGRRRVLAAASVVHRTGLRGLAVSPDGARLAATGVDVAVWNPATGTGIRPAGLPRARYAGFDAAGILHTVACAGSCADGRSRIDAWDPARDSSTPLAEYARSLTAVAFAGALMAGAGCWPGPSAAGACQQGFLQLFTAATGQPRGEPIVTAGARIGVIALSPDGGHVVVGTDDGGLQLWDAGTGRLIDAWRGHTGPVRAVAFSPDGHQIATGGQDGRSVVWNTSNVRTGGRVFAAYPSPVTTLAFAPGGHQLAAGNELNLILLWALDADPHTSIRFTEADTAPRSVAVSPDGTAIVIGDADGFVTVVDRQTRLVRRRFPVAPICPEHRADIEGRYHPCFLSTLAFSPDGHNLVAASWTGNIARWDTRSWAPLGDPLAADVPCRSLICDGHRITSNRLAFSPDLGLVAAAAGPRILVWDLHTRTLRSTLNGHTGDVKTLAFSADGAVLASGAEDHTVRLWSVPDGRPLGSPMNHDEAVTAVAFQPGQPRLASLGQDNTVRFWDTGTHHQAASFTVDNVTDESQLVFSVDGARVAVSMTEAIITIRDTATLTEYPPLREAATIFAAAFGPGRDELVVLSEQLTQHTVATVTVRPLDVARWRHIACGMVPRNLEHRLIEAYTVDSSPLCPGIPVDGSIIRHQLAIAADRDATGDADGAESAFAEAARLTAADDNDDVELAGLVCRRGAYDGHAAAVMPACDRAVELAPDAGPYRDARGIARALTGDRTGAAADLRLFLAWSDSLNGFRLSAAGLDIGLLDPAVAPARQAWIARLDADGAPPSPAELRQAWTEYVTDSGGTTDELCPIPTGAGIEWVRRPTGC